MSSSKKLNFMKRRKYGKSFPLNEQEGSSVDFNQQSFEFIEEVLNNDEMSERDVIFWGLMKVNVLLLKNV